MAKDNQNIILINKHIPKDALPATTPLTNQHIVSVDLSKQHHILQILEQFHNDINVLEIYDITYCPKLLYGDIISVSDHINRIGHNPLIGKQKTFGIDFIDIANLYYLHKKGVVTNSLGKAFQLASKDQFGMFALAKRWPNPSTFLANVAILGYIYKYIIKAHLINIKL